MMPYSLLKLAYGTDPITEETINQTGFSMPMDIKVAMRQYRVGKEEKLRRLFKSLPRPRMMRGEPSHTLHHEIRPMVEPNTAPSEPARELMIFDNLFGLYAALSPSATFQAGIAT